MRCLALALVILGCGGASTPPARAGNVRADLVCTETLPSGEAVCVAQGCQWGPPLWCSGIASEPDSTHADATRPCTCVCESDQIRCASVP